MKRNIGDVEEPFACDIPSCIMKCTTEDRLEHHKKSHDIQLNVSNKMSNFVDQTPTPTRFIRNCEEVGLFQDLQNVNPFDETFRKAMETPKSDDSSLRQGRDIGLALDDTLHTPLVFHPSHEQKSSANIPTTSACNNCQTTPSKTEKLDSDSWEDKPHIFLLDRNVALKLPISRLATTSRPTMKVFHPKAFSVMSSHATKNASIVKNPASSLKKDEKRNSIELKESNRMAAVRSREKKKHYIAYMEELNKSLTEKLERMEAVVATLKSENESLKEQLRNGRLSDGGVDLPTRTEIATAEAAATIREEQRVSFYATLPSIEREVQYTEQPKVDFILRKPIKKRSVPPNQC